MKVLQIEGMLCLMSMLWNDKMALLALKAAHFFCEILRVIRYVYKTNRMINTK